MDTVQQQNPFKSAIWPLVMLALILFFGIRFHGSVLSFLACGAVWLVGAVVEIIQYGKDEETLFPDVVCTLAAAAMGIWMLA